MDDRVGLELHAGLDPGRGGVDDRHAGEHVREVDPVAQRCSGGGELGARVHALGLGGIGGDDARRRARRRSTRSRTASVR